MTQRFSIVVVVDDSRVVPAIDAGVGGGVIATPGGLVRSTIGGEVLGLAVVAVIVGLIVDRGQHSGMTIS
jgi:hypothetical protein